MTLHPIPPDHLESLARYLVKSNDVERLLEEYELVDVVEEEDEVLYILRNREKGERVEIYIPLD